MLVPKWWGSPGRTTSDFPVVGGAAVLVAGGCRRWLLGGFGEVSCMFVGRCWVCWMALVGEVRVETSGSVRGKPTCIRDGR